MKKFFLFILLIPCSLLYAQMRDLPTNEPNKPAVPLTPTPTPANTIQTGGPNPFLVPQTSLPSPVEMFGGKTPDTANTGNNTAPSLSGTLKNAIEKAGFLKDMPTGTNVSPANASAENFSAPQAANDYFEAETEDERLDRELNKLKQDAINIADPERHKAALAEVEQQEAVRKRWLERRKKAEYGAELFIMPRLRETYLKNGWCQLFDGKTNFGWTTQQEGHYAGGQFLFEDGEIKSDPYHPGLLLTKAQFASFVLRFEYWTEPDAEAMMLLKTPVNPHDLYTSCYTIILNSANENRPRGLIFGRQNLQEQIFNENQSRTSGQDSGWHTVTVRCDQGQIQLLMDRQSPTLYADTKTLPHGHIGFLAAKGSVRFRNILWQCAAPMELFEPEQHLQNPKKLSNSKNFQSLPNPKHGPVFKRVWRDLSKNITFARNPETGIYRLSGGPGSVETQDTFKNYVLQFEYYVGITSARHSLFFRSIPDRPETGYEVSLQNLPTLADRESVAGVDAGAFRNIKDARYVRAVDQEWNYMTLLVADRYFQTWVNGVPVCEATDKRKMKTNAPTGPFLEDGTLRFYAPETGASLHLRNIKITPY